MKFDFRHRFIPESIELPPPTEQQITEANNFIPQFVQYEPMRQNRWLIHFPEEMGVDSWFLSSTQRPSVNIVNGITNWNPIVLKLRDPIGERSTSRKLWELLGGITNDTDAFQSTPELRERYTNIRENGLTFVLDMLDPTGVVVSKWSVNGNIQDIKFGNLDYSSSDLMECELIVNPLSVILFF